MQFCGQCKSPFEILPISRDFYARMTVPAPTLCSACRLQRRYAFRNERKLYRRKCDLTGKSIISFHHPDKPFKVYDQHAWWSDAWDPMSYGRDFDFSRPFFGQFAELQLAVPRMSMIVSHSENCDYAPYSLYSKNCYMCVSTNFSEDMLYCYQANYSRDSVDCALCLKCELCYECVYCIELYSGAFCKNCDHSSNLYFCQDCKNCKNCIGCKNLAGKEYHIFNQRVPKEEFERLKAGLAHSQGIVEMGKKASTFFLTKPQRANYQINCENCTGDNIVECKNSVEVFDAKGLEDCAYIIVMPSQAKDCQDTNYAPDCELVYDSLSAVGYNLRFALHSWDMKESSYADECFYSQNLFGCIGLRRKEYCVLNKQYTKEEYTALIPKIIEHMKKTGEWGNFFPMTLSPYAYNETIAQENFSLSKEAALVRGLKWRDEETLMPNVEKEIPATRLPDTIGSIPDDILNWAIRCETTKRPFKLQKEELRFYRKQDLPVPHLHPDERHRRRTQLRNSGKLFARQCAKCGAEVQTTYAPDRPEKVYCDGCYLKEVY